MSGLINTCCAKNNTTTSSRSGDFAASRPTSRHFLANAGVKDKYKVMMMFLVVSFPEINYLLLVVVLLLTVCFCIDSSITFLCDLNTFLTV